MATYDLTSTTPSKIKTGDILNCPYSGSVKSITLPKGQYKLECWGAQGGASSYHKTTGGNGGYSVGTYTINTKTTLYLYTGGKGNTGSVSVDGGYNGGGGVTSSYNTGGTGNHLGTGGGASDISLVGGECTKDSYFRYIRTADSYNNRIIVAGGGGGAEGANGTAGGGTSGVSSYGGSQSAAGNAYINDAGRWVTLYAGGFGYGVSTSGGHTSHAMGSCGGGGYYGGGCFAKNGSTACGAGGSGYVDTTKLTNASTVAGNTTFTSPTGTSETGHTGNGYIRITVLDIQSGNILIKVPSELPSTYSQLEYLQLTGSQYINTGVTVDSNTGFDITFEPLNGQSSSPYYNLFGVRGNDSSGGTSETQNFFRIDTIPVDSNTGTEFKYGTTIYNSGIKDTSKINIKLINKVYTKPDGSTITLSGTITSGLPMYIGCINKKNAPYGNKASMKIYRFKIYSGSTLTNDYIPALRISDSVSGLYDIKTNTFKTDAAGGTFTNGDTINPWKNTKQIFINTGSGSSIPSGLVELDYIESTGTQYIDTGIKASKSIKIEADINVSAASGWVMILGDYTSGSYFSWWRKDTTVYAYYGSNNKTLAELTGKRKYTSNDTNNVWSIDTSKITVTPNSSDFSKNGNNLYLFSVNNGGSYNKASMKLYSCKIYNNGTLIRDFIPAKRTSDGKCGLWDKVSYRFYVDENGGNFTAGTEKSAIAAVGTAIEYLEATGTQYIDTNILGQDISKVNVDFQFTSVPSGAEAQIAAVYASSAVYFQIGWSGSSFMRTSEYTYSQTANSLARTQAEGTPTGRPAYNLWLFGQNEIGTLKHPASAKIYSCKIYDNNNILVRDFIPIKTATNIYGLWDKVNKAFYPNAGTGAFTGGPAVTLTGWHKIKGVWAKTTANTWSQAL